MGRAGGPPPHPRTSAAASSRPLLVALLFAAATLSFSAPGVATYTDIEPFVSVGKESFDRPLEFDDDLSHFKWAWATAESYRRIGAGYEPSRKALRRLAGSGAIDDLDTGLAAKPSRNTSLAARKGRYDEAMKR
ncbi:MAG: hypothetical protein P8R42_27450 [Candidatus Binatia bacterium]|nr:hypothetical protein [Candidatus Binatia bacterium]